ncbi:MAG TPA: membrane protein insertase YidC [Candidatus Onthovivens sp.]|nr:membrane protein insertase YidC [Candidatus Onthovivens sp.]
MNTKTKRILGIAAIVVTAGVLTSCNSFCSVSDTSHYRYAYDPVNTVFFENTDDGYSYLLEKFNNPKIVEGALTVENLAFSDGNDTYLYVENKEVFEKEIFTKINDDLIKINTGKLVLNNALKPENKDDPTSVSTTIGLNDFVMDTNKQAFTQGISIPSFDYYDDFDNIIFDDILKAATASEFKPLNTLSKETITYSDVYGYSAKQLSDYKALEPGDAKDALLKDMLNGTSEIKGRNNSLFARFGFIKHQTIVDEKVNYMGKIEEVNNKLATSLSSSEIMSQNYLNLYSTLLNNKVAVIKTCISIEDGFYGQTSNDPLNSSVFIEAKATDFFGDWGSAFSKYGFLEGLLVYPISYAVESLSHTFGMNGWGQVAAVLLVTIVVRALFMLITFPATLSQQKMTYLQPEIAKLQQKYPNSTTNQYEKQKMAQAQMALYKKNKVHPMMSMAVMVVQFPLFICVWNALTGSASLSSDAVLGLRLSDTIWNVLSNFSGWPGNAGWWTALVLILLMSGAQILAVMLPQLLTKARTKNVAKLQKNPAQNQQAKQMKWMQWIMTGFIIVMGFSLPSAMGVYWFAGAIFGVLQSLLMHFIFARKDKKSKGSKN